MAVIGASALAAHFTPLPRWPGWRHLPRDARDTLFLLGVIGWTLLPHVAHLPWWTSVLALLVLLWRGRLALDSAPLPSRWTVAAVLLVAATLTAISERTLLGKEAGVIMLVLLMVLKTLELRARRDALVVFFLGFFLVLTNFLYSQSIAVALAMLVSVWGLLSALVLAHMPVGQPSLRHAASLSARAALLGAPVMVVLFVLFPRIGPLWGLPEDAGAKTGLSGTMRMGAVAEVANDDSIALRVRFLGATPPPQALYFRGPVLGAFDGVEWKRVDSGTELSPESDLELLGPSFDYEITLEPSRLALLPLLQLTPDRPGAAPQATGWRMRQRPDLQWALDRPLSERLRVQARAWPRFRSGVNTPLWTLREDLQLPPGYNPRMLQWAEQLRADPRHARADAAHWAALLLDHIRDGSYVYTLAPGEYGRDGIDEFWFDRRQGFCEHYAAAFVFAMRALGVPARVVTGYQGADAQPVDGYWIVRQSHAHAWAEYWQRGRGWVHADPTAAVAPERIVRSRNLVPARGIVVQAIGNVSPQLMTSLRNAWEALNNRWNQWVLGYSSQQQFDLLRNLGIDAPQWTDLGLLLAELASVAALTGALWAWWDRRRQDPWARLLQRVRKRLQRLGLPAPEHESARMLAADVRKTLGDAGTALAARLEALDRLRYGPQAAARPQSDWWRAFCAEAARIGSR